VAASANLTARANHDHITVDLFYHGSEVSVRGVSDPGAELIVKLESPETGIVMKKKDKVGGIIWMNTGKVHFEDIPDLYFVQSSKPLDEILSAEEQNSYIVGYGAVKDHATVSPAKDQAEKDMLFGQFLKFKESNKVYLAKSGGFDMETKDDVQSYYMNFDWPYQAKPGDYTVTVYAVKDGKVVETATAKVDVEQVGAVKALAGMARNNGAVYGVLSVLAALMAGFGVGMVFKGGGAH
jgi:uncharacterized protein (TIGR02186 family)